jgi:hypothetical protein
MPAAHIRVIATPNGGRLRRQERSVQPRDRRRQAALLLDRPVKICLNREEVFYCHRGAASRV